MNAPENTSSQIAPKMEESWKQALAPEFQKEYFATLKQFLVKEKKQYAVYPPGSQIFAAFQNTPFQKVKVVILGQDPYHGLGQANGLCFSVSPGVRQPPSLQNILQEIKQDLGIPVPSTGDLSPWTQQGVLLLNATLTVRAGSAGSHQNQGWELFTDSIIQLLSQKREGLVFLLWGKFARSKKEFIDTQKHHVLEASHPSPFSAHSGFFGCKHFSKTNQILQSKGEEPIQWSLE